MKFHIFFDKNFKKLTIVDDPKTQEIVFNSESEFNLWGIGTTPKLDAENPIHLRCEDIADILDWLSSGGKKNRQLSHIFSKHFAPPYNSIDIYHCLTEINLLLTDLKENPEKMKSLQAETSRTSCKPTADVKHSSYSSSTSSSSLSPLFHDHKPIDQSMLKIELEFIQKIKKFGNKRLSDEDIDLLELESLWNVIQKNPAGTFTLQFIRAIEDIINDKDNYRYIKFYLNLPFEAAILRILTEKYLKLEPSEQLKPYTKIEETLKKLKNTQQKSGIKLIPECLRDGVLVRSVYMCGNSALIDLFAKYLPPPKIGLFIGNRIPATIEAADHSARRAVSSFLERNGKSAEQKVVYLQRYTRYKIRQSEEQHRIASMLASYKKDAKAALKVSRELLQNANTPYKPQKCSPELAKRILDAAKKVKLFSEIRHCTATETLGSALDQLYGQKNLQRNYMSYRATADEIDRQGGDSNTVFFATNKAQPLLLRGKSVDFVMDFDMLSMELRSHPHCSFYKQRDFGFELDEIRTVILDDISIEFCHTATSMPSMNSTDFSLKLSGSSQRYSCELASLQFIAYDIAKVHQILTLNFFRFLDNIQLANDKSSSANTFIAQIYEKIAGLKTEALIEFLQKLGKNISDTSEFNFYGGYQINFDYLKKINFYIDDKLSRSISPKKLISLLSTGDVELLEKVKLAHPGLFQSYRFCDYFLSKIEHPKIREKLIEYRSACSPPGYLTIPEAKSAPTISSVPRYPSNFFPAADQPFLIRHYESGIGSSSSYDFLPAPK